MAVVLVDQDGVLAGFEPGLFGAFKAKHPNGPVVAVADRRGFYAREHYKKLGPEWGKAVDAIIRTEGFYRNLDPVDGALAALEEMRQAGHHVFICTSPLSNAPWCVPEKLAWVQHQLGGSWLRRTVITSDKTLVGDRLQPCVLVDDRPEIKGVASPPAWTHVLFDAPYNQGQPGPRLSAWADWREVLEPVLAGQQRPDTAVPD
jgi:5'-nucleotidase